MLRYVLACHRPLWAAQLGISRTLPAPPRTLALTFDDGPHPEGTAEVLDVLARQHARATFFVVGEQVVRFPQLVRRARAEGHSIALHGYRHRLHLRRSASELREDFRRGLAAVEDAIGERPRYHRPPYGIYSPASLALARELGLKPLLWSAWGKDWRKLATPEQIAGSVLRELSTGDLILLHDADHYSASGSHHRTAAALVRILTALKSTGLEICELDT